MRLDVYLTEKGMAKSRSYAKELIEKGSVTVNGAVASKASLNIEDGCEVTVDDDCRYVGRGGYKLEKALDSFKIDLNGKICMDIGASTGGFTDCMLQNGAELVYSVDVGHDQLDPKLCADSRVRNMERTDIRSIDCDRLDKMPQFIGADVSFISLRKIMPYASQLLAEGGEAVMLIKPQFECGRSDIGKNGIVKDKKVHVRVINEIISECNINGLAVRGLDFSPVQGGSGNTEYLIYVKKGGESISADAKAVTENAARLFKHNGG